MVSDLSVALVGWCRAFGTGVALVAVVAACGVQPTDVVTGQAVREANTGPGWPAVAVYELERRWDGEHFSTERAEFAASSWSSWTQVTLAPGEVGASDGARVERFDGDRFQGGFSGDVEEGEALDLERQGRLPEDTTLAVDDAQTAPDGQAAVDDAHLPQTSASEFEGEGRAPNDMMNTKFGSTAWTQYPDYELLEDFDSAPGGFPFPEARDVEATARRLGLDPADLTQVAFRHDECEDPVDCERWLTIYHTGTGVPLEVQWHFWGGREVGLLRTDRASFDE